MVTTVKKTWSRSMPAVVCYIVGYTIMVNVIFGPMALIIQESPTMTIHPVAAFLATPMQMVMVMLLTCVALRRPVTQWLFTVRAWLWLGGTAGMVRIVTGGLSGLINSLPEPPSWVTTAHHAAVNTLLLAAFILLATKLLELNRSKRCIGYAACFVALPLLQDFLMWALTQQYSGPQMTPSGNLNLFFLQEMLSFWVDEQLVYPWIHILSAILPVFICHAMAERPQTTAEPFLLTVSQAKGRQQWLGMLAAWGGLYLLTQICAIIELGVVSLETWSFWIGLGLLLASDFRLVRGRWIAATILSSVWWGFWLMASRYSPSALRTPASGWAMHRTSWQSLSVSWHTVQAAISVTTASI